MNNVLVPTDFTPQSLEGALQAVKKIDDKCNIFFFHAFDMPQSLTDAISRSGVYANNRFLTEELRFRCKKLKNEDSRINNIYFRSMYGSTMQAFRNFVEANDIDTIFLPINYRYAAVTRESVDPTSWFRKAGMRTIAMDYQDTPAIQRGLPNALGLDSASYM